MADMLATTADLANALGINISALDSARATLALELATGAVQAAAGQRIARVVGDTWTTDLDFTDCGPYLDLPEWPVISVASATVGATAVTDYSTLLSRGQLWRALSWRSATLPYWNSPSTVTVVYTHGYAPADQKLQLARGVTLSAAKAGYESTSDGGPVIREQIDDYAVQYAQIAAAVEGALDPDGPLAKALRRQYGRPRRSARLVAHR